MRIGYLTLVLAQVLVEALCRSRRVFPFSYCEITIADLLVTAQVFAGNKGTEKGKWYCTTTVTRSPGLLQEVDGEQTVPDGNADHVVVTVIAAGSMPG